MRIKDWLKNQITALSIAFSNVESDVLGQKSTSATQEFKQERRHQQGNILDNLLHGEMTQEVKDLRWRMYKVLSASNQYQFDVNDEKSKRKVLARIKNVKIDEIDQYPLEMVVDNQEITKSTIDVVGNIDDSEVKGNDYLAMLRGEKPIQIIMDFMPKFDIGQYSTKLNIRTIDETNKLLEFYVSKYPDEFNFTQNLFLKEIRKIIAGEKANNDFLDIKEVGFISYKTLGAPTDFLMYGYKVLSFDKIIEFNGYYVIKFKAEIVVNGESTIAHFVEEGLEKKYKNKELRKKKK